jgi:formylglycine-generating enzyme required for sulfatase activity
MEIYRQEGEIGGLIFRGAAMRSVSFLGKLFRNSHLNGAIMVVGAALSTLAPSQAGIVSFGSADRFSMEFKEIGNINNAADTNSNANRVGRGSVGYNYLISKFEVSRGMIASYNANFGTANNLVVSAQDTGTADSAATQIHWQEAARFVNWLNTSTGGFAAYKFAPGSTVQGGDGNPILWTSTEVDDYDAGNRFRSKRARYVLPTLDEWYKAAYYDADNSVYYDYAQGSNTAPTSIISGTGPNTAVYRRDDYFDDPSLSPSDTASIYLAGGLSKYGVMGMEGNAMELIETAFDGSNDIGSENRINRGGAYNDSLSALGAGNMYSVGVSSANAGRGFRVAALSLHTPVPEPTSMVIFGFGALGMAYRARRRTSR